MAVSGEAPVKLVSAVPHGTPVAEVQSTDFGSVYEMVELATDSDSESVVGGHGLGFNQNRSEVTPTPSFPALGLCLRLAGRELTRQEREREDVY
jgi:hypothetical protein